MRSKLAAKSTFSCARGMYYQDCGYDPMLDKHHLQEVAYDRRAVEVHLDMRLETAGITSHHYRSIAVAFFAKSGVNGLLADVAPYLTVDRSGRVLEFFWMCVVIRLAAEKWGWLVIRVW